MVETGDTRPCAYDVDLIRRSGVNRSYTRKRSAKIHSDYNLVVHSLLRSRRSRARAVSLGHSCAAQCGGTGLVSGHALIEQRRGSRMYDLQLRRGAACNGSGRLGQPGCHATYYVSSKTNGWYGAPMAWFRGLRVGPPCQARSQIC